MHTVSNIRWEVTIEIEVNSVSLGTETRDYVLTCANTSVHDCGEIN